MNVQSAITANHLILYPRLRRFGEERWRFNSVQICPHPAKIIRCSLIAGAAAPV
jgi:hypothetical protein